MWFSAAKVGGEKYMSGAVFPQKRVSCRRPRPTPLPTRSATANEKAGPLFSSSRRRPRARHPFKPPSSPPLPPPHPAAAVPNLPSTSPPALGRRGRPGRPVVGPACGGHAEDGSLPPPRHRICRVRHGGTAAVGGRDRVGRGVVVGGGDHRSRRRRQALPVCVGGGCHTTGGRLPAGERHRRRRRCVARLSGWWIRPSHYGAAVAASAAAGRYIPACPAECFHVGRHGRRRRRRRRR